MNHPIRATLVTAMALFASACAPNNGFLVQGTVGVSINEGSGAPTVTGFSFPPSTQVDPALPSGRSTGFIGTCSVGPNGRSVVLQRIGGDQLGLQSATFTMPDWSSDTCANCQRGTVNFVVGSTSFVGTHTAGQSSPCQFSAARTGSYDMQLQVQCRGVSSGSRSADLDVSLSLDLCSGPQTRN